MDFGFRSGLFLEQTLYACLDQSCRQAASGIHQEFLQTNKQSLYHTRLLFLCYFVSDFHQHFQGGVFILTLQLFLRNGSFNF